MTRTRIVLQLMVKNEALIIERCLACAMPFVDGIAVYDTGSTDETVDICKEYLQRCGKPFRIETGTFVNFGVSRTESFQVAQRCAEAAGWDAAHAYALALDADMLLLVSPAFQEQHLTAGGYQIIQVNGSLQYYNTRLLGLAHPWTCVGSTHEFWRGAAVSKLDKELIHIEDRNDGGCKADKFERDIRLLTHDIQTDPRDVRAHYYLAQSLKDVGRFADAIDMFKKRIALGDWIEECWYSYYQIGKCYDAQGDEASMEYWMNKAHAFYPKRAEPLYYLTRVFRERSQHYKAYHYYLKGRHIPFPADDILFIEHAVYTGLFEYENTILACYVHTHDKLGSQLQLLQYVNTWSHHRDNVFSNWIFYVEPLLSLAAYGGTYVPLILPYYTPPSVHDEYHASSCTVIPYTNDAGNIFLNVRYVNYRIDRHGGYHMRDNIVRTKNALVQLDADLRVVTRAQFATETYDAIPDVNIRGIEDARVFKHAHSLRFTASCADIVTTDTAERKIVVVCGEYVMGESGVCLQSIVPLASPDVRSTCEKNWLYVPHDCMQHPEIDTHNVMHFIYSWHPFQIGMVDMRTSSRQLQICMTQQTPACFTHFRGSCGPVLYKNKVYVLIHHVKYGSPRIYLHGLVQCSVGTMCIEAYTPLFCFRKLAIEYCIGMRFNETNDTVTFFISENDSTPGCISVPLSRFKWCNLK